MTHDNDLGRAIAALEKADENVRELEAKCCRPERSPRMEELAQTLSAARSGVAQISRGGDAADEVIRILEDAGSQLGCLQITCCAPGRMKLYAATLENLTQAQRAISRSRGGSH